MSSRCGYEPETSDVRISARARRVTLALLVVLAVTGVLALAVALVG